MIDKVVDCCEKLTKKVGVEVKLDESVKKLKRVSIASNSLVGVGLVTVGLLLSSKVLATVGILGLAGAVAMAACNAGDKESDKDSEASK
ncbi:MAG: hypothetical protein FWD05_12915 [Oscillospiraceae bacterium]|nr:hypothetical protein [Oscillospiraceae bacterium]